MTTFPIFGGLIHTIVVSIGSIFVALGVAMTGYSEAPKEQVTENESQEVVEVEMNNESVVSDDVQINANDATSVENYTIKSKDVVVETKASVASRDINTESSPVSTPIVKTNVVTNNSNFTLRCKLSAQNVGLDDYVTASLKIYEDQEEGQSKNYEISWNQTDLSNSGEKEGKFKFSDEGSHNISVTAKNKITNQVSTENCGSIYVECDEFDCLSHEEQQKVLRKDALTDIINLINDWYGDDYPYLTAAYQCSIAESIVRAHLYEYTTAGGLNAPEFSEGVDCANDLAPKAYKYKIELLKSTL